MDKPALNNFSPIANFSAKFGAFYCAAMFLFLGCSSSGNSNKPIYRAPSYALMTTEGWEVKCNFREVTVLKYREKSFYKKDGTQKSFDEFCAEARTGTHVIK